MTYAKLVLLLLQIVDKLVSYGIQQKQIQQADEEAIVRLTSIIQNRTRYAQGLDKKVDDLSDSELADRLRAIQRK